MTMKQYLAALKSLGLTVAGQRTADVLGLSVRQVQRFASGESEIPGSVAKLLEAYQRHGLPPE
jgi:transcriptional regulator with XRE-family HTH domain